MNTKKKICFENIICLYGMMNEIASKKMTAYKSDLEIDFEDMKAREKDGFSFLWAVRETGTWFRPFQTNGECNFNNKEDYKTFMYSVLDLEGYIGIHQDYYIINVNYHGEYSIQHVSKLNAKKAIDTCLENFNKYRLDIVRNGEIIDSTAPTKGVAEQLTKEYKTAFHGSDFDIKAVAI